MSLFFRTVKTLLIYVFVAISVLDAASEVRALFVGNSLTHRLREVDLPLVTPNAEVSINPHFHTNCGQGLATTVFEDPETSCGPLREPYTGGAIYDSLRGEAWDALVFQPFSGTAFGELEAIKTMIDIHRCAYPDNRPKLYLYATWPGRPEAVTGGFDFLWEQDTFEPSDAFKRDRRGLHWIYRRLKEDYPEWEVTYIGVGDVLVEVERYIDTGLLPSIGSIHDIFADSIHHGNIGHWIAAQTITSAILGVDPNGFKDLHPWYSNTNSAYGLRVLHLPSVERKVIKSVIREVLSIDPCDCRIELEIEPSSTPGELDLYFDLPYDSNLFLEQTTDFRTWQPIEQAVGRGGMYIINQSLDRSHACYRGIEPDENAPKYYQPNEEKAPKYRVAYQPADLNHIIIAGQSNAVGYNGTLGDPITVSQPYQNLMFSPLLMRRYYADSDEASSPSDIAPLDYELWVGSGLRAPMNNVLMLRVDGRRVFWGPGGKTTTTWQYEQYRQALGGVSFQPLRESLEYDGKHSESFASTVCNALTRRTGHRFMGSVSGIGGAQIFSLDARERNEPEGYPYRKTVDLASFSPELEGMYATGGFAQTLAQVERAKELAVEQGLSYKVAAIVWIQGESDHSNESYGKTLSRMVNHYNQAIRAITGQDEDVFFICDAVSYNSAWAGVSGILPVDDQLNLAQRDSAEISNEGRVYLAGPRYPYNPATHYAPQSVVAKGEVIAQAIEQVVFRRRPWQGIALKSISVSTSAVVCDFHVPVPPLQCGITKSNSVGRSILSSMSEHYGFQVKNPEGRSILDSVEIIRPTTVRLNCSEDPSGADVSYGMRVLGNGSTLRGNLCDSHNYPSLFEGVDGKPYDARNWAMPFYELLGVDD